MWLSQCLHKFKDFLTCSCHLLNDVAYEDVRLWISRTMASHLRASQLELSHLLSQIPDRPKQQATDAKRSTAISPLSQACWYRALGHASLTLCPTPSKAKHGKAFLKKKPFSFMKLEVCNRAKQQRSNSNVRKPSHVDSKKLGSKIGPRGQLGRLACCACLQGLLSYLLRSVPDPSGYSTWQHVIHVIQNSTILSFTKAWAHRIFKRFLRSNFVNSKFSYCNTCTNLFKWPIKTWHSSKGKIVKSLKLWHIDKRLFSHCCKSLIGRMDRISFSVAMHLFGSWQSGYSMVVEYVHEGMGLWQKRSMQHHARSKICIAISVWTWKILPSSRCSLETSKKCVQEAELVASKHECLQKFYRDLLSVWPVRINLLNVHIVFVLFFRFLLRNVYKDCIAVCLQSSRLKAKFPIVLQYVAVLLIICFQQGGMDAPVIPGSRLLSAASDASALASSILLLFFTSAPTSAPSAPVIIHLATFIVIIIFVVLSKLVHVVSALKSRGNRNFLPQSCNKVSEGSTAFHDYTLIEFKLTWSRARIDWPHLILIILIEDHSNTSSIIQALFGTDCVILMGRSEHRKGSQKARTMGKNCKHHPIQKSVLVGNHLKLQNGLYCSL